MSAHTLAQQIKSSRVPAPSRGEQNEQLARRGGRERALPPQFCANLKLHHGNQIPPRPLLAGSAWMCQLTMPIYGRPNVKRLVRVSLEQ